MLTINDSKKQLPMEVGEKASGMDSCSKLICRACANTCGSFYSINSNISYFTPTLKDMIILLVPQMESFLDDNDVVCQICRKVLVHCVKFIEKCLRVEADRVNDSSQKDPVNSHPYDLKCDETLSTDSDYEPLPGDENPLCTNLDKDNLFDQQDTNSSKLNGNVEKNIDTDQVIQIEMDDLFTVVQKDNNTYRLNGVLKNHLKTDQITGTIESENSQVVNDISPTEGVKAFPNSILRHNRLISVTQLSTGELNKFVGILASNNVETHQYSQSSKQSTERKRIILVGSTFKCNLCSEYFITRGKYEHHMRIHKRLEQRQVERLKLKKLRLQKLEEKKLRKLNSQMNPPERKQRSNSKIDLECKTCLEICSSREDLAFHVIIHPPFVCEKCGKGFAFGHQLGAHKEVHNDPNSYICEVCGKSYKTLNQFRAHRLLHENTSHLCNKCPKAFNTIIKLRKHLKYTHGEGLTKFWSCMECKKVFKQPSALKTHYRHMHLKENKFICEMCGQGFCRSDYLKRHKRRHTIYGDKPVRKRSISGPYQCQICTKVWKSLAYLKLHIKSHGTLSRFSCKYCGMTFKIKYQRNRHEKLHEHSDLKYRCGICWKRLESQEELDQHSLIHNNLKYECESCGQSFARKHLLDDHIVNSHVENGDAEEEMRTLLAAGLGELN